MKRTRIRQKSDRQRLVGEADNWARLIVLGRQGPLCLKCGKEKPLQAAHILPKSHYPSLRFDVDSNIVGLCVACHLYWAHKDPLGFYDWLNATFPGRLEKLRLAGQMVRKVDLKETICVLKDIAKREGAA